MDEKEKKILKKLIEQSREYRAKKVKEFGKVPTSVWDIDYSKNKLMFDPRGRKNISADKKMESKSIKDLNDELGNALSIRYRSVRGKENKDSHSILPYDFAEKILKFYMDENDKIFLNPCMGDMASMNLAYFKNKSFIGYDVSKVNFGINKDLREQLLGLSKQQKLVQKDVEINIYHKSSENMEEVSTNYVDFIFSSPPYWDLEFYGNEAEQLGYKKSYKEFLEGLSRIIKECYRVLRPGKFIALNINDFRKDKKMYDYHIDTINLMTEAGFKRWDTIIIRWPSCVGQAFATQVFGRKVSAKTHEYLVVGRKPGYDETPITHKSVIKPESKKEEIIKVKPNIDIPEEKVLNMIKKYDNMIDREKAIELIQEENKNKGGETK